jgi:hypothetical protein
MVSQRLSQVGNTESTRLETSPDIESVNRPNPIDKPSAYSDRQALSHTSAHGVFFGRLPFAGYDLGKISSHNGIPYFSNDGVKWIRAHTGDMSLFKTVNTRPRLYDQMQTSPGSPGSSAAQQRESLPPRSIVDDCFAIVCSLTLRLFFPVVDTVLFKYTIDLAYALGSRPLPIEVRYARANIFSLLCIIALLSPSRAIYPPDFWSHYCSPTHCL